MREGAGEVGGYQVEVFADREAEVHALDRVGDDDVCGGIPVVSRDDRGKVPADGELVAANGRDGELGWRELDQVDETG